MAYQPPEPNVYGSVIQSAAQPQPEPKEQPQPEPKEQQEPEAQQEFYRFNLKTPIEYKDYLQEISWRNRTSITEYLNRLIAADMKAHPNWRDTLDILNK